MIETILRRWVACLAVFSAMSMASPPPLPYTTLVRFGGAVLISASARAARALDGK